MKKTVKTMIAAVYGLGTAIAVILLALFISRSNTVLSPDAMLPIPLCELASMWLAIGFIPMVLVSVLLCKAFRISEGGHRVRNTLCAFLPAAVCLCFLVFWVGVWGAGFLNLALRS